MKRRIIDFSSSQLGDIWYRFKKNKPAMVGLVIIFIIINMALFADVIADYQSQVIEQHPEIRLEKPSREHWFGTDGFGRDLFARIVHGSRYSLAFGLICSLIGLVGGSTIGATAAFFGGKVDNLIMRGVDVIMSIPGILLTLALIAALGLGLKNMIIAMSIGMIPGFTRIVRSQVLIIVKQDYIEAAKSCGVSNKRLIFFHVLPNAIGMIIVNATMSISGLIIGAAGLSFIGMGIQPPAPEWGSMVSGATSYMRLYPHVVFFPGMAIIITALSFNLLGDGLADALDPRMKD